MTFNGLNSYDPDGDALTYVWEGVTGTLEGAVVTETVPIGEHTVTLTVSDGELSDTDTVQVKVVEHAAAYEFVGFLSPIKNDGTSVFRTGSAIPVKFQLKGKDGSYISDITAELYVARIVNGIEQPPIKATCAGSSNEDNFFRCSIKLYIYDVKTDDLEPGIWKLKVLLADSSQFTVVIELK